MQRSGKNTPSPAANPHEVSRLVQIESEIIDGCRHGYIPQHLETTVGIMANKASPMATDSSRAWSCSTLAHGIDYLNKEAAKVDEEELLLEAMIKDSLFI